MTHQTRTAGPTSVAATQTLGVVSYLNARPLYDCLTDRDDLTLKAAVPAELAEMLLTGQCDVALLPIVDYWRHKADLQPVSDACIASDGETMTVRVFSKQPTGTVRRLHVDGDSHTSIILAQIVWRELYGSRLELVPWKRDSHGSLDDVDALLLIGDKVVSQSPAGFGFEVDLGSAWKYLTGLPFVFAGWYGAAGADFAELAPILSTARDRGRAEAERIARRYAAQHGWPEETAVQYLARTLKFELTGAMRTAMDRFFALAVDHDLLP
jgi:chorismate dehydratase